MLPNITLLTPASITSMAFGANTDTTTTANIAARLVSSSCPRDGALFSNGSTQFGVCAFGHVIWQSVAAGTVCKCSNGSCSIVTANDIGSLCSSQPATVTVTVTAPANTSTAAPAPSSTAAVVHYETYLGNGEPSQGWPAQSSWITFDKLWTANINAGILGASCTSAFKVKNNSPQDNANIKSALLAEAKSTGIDARFILSIMNQESLGCVYGTYFDTSLRRRHFLFA